MKKTKLLAGIVAVSLLISLASCSNSSGGSSDDEALAGIKIDGVLYEKTGEVYATGKDGASISGKTNTDNYAGVFVEGRNVTLSPFIMSKYQVTQELYTAVMTGQKVTVGGEEKALEPSPFYCKETGSYPLVNGEKQNLRPAEGVTWYDAVYFCNALTEKTMNAEDKVYTITNIDFNNGHIEGAEVTADMTKKGYRLPTEAEWEFAARGGDPTKPAWDYLFSGAAKADGTNYGDSENTGLDSVGWYWYNTLNGTTGNSTPSIGNKGYGTHEVGKKAANALGIYDMSGNVWEWCYDRYDSSVGKENEANPAGPASGSYRVYRGGSWGGRALYCSVAYRGNYGPNYRGNYLGFRVVRSAN